MHRNKKRKKQKCVCGEPLCGKCLGVNCQDDDCLVHTHDLKLSWAYKRGTIKPIRHIIEDLFYPELNVIFCGMAVGKESFKRQCFYANSNNKFWRILKDAKFISTQLKPQDYQELLKYKIGLTDLAKNQCGSDGGVRITKWHRLTLRDEINKCRPKILAFNGKNSAEEFLQRKVDYGEVGNIGETSIWVLESTSPANGHWNNGKHWKQLAQKIIKLC